MDSKNSPSLPQFASNEQLERRKRKQMLFKAVQDLTNNGCHKEALSVWKELTDLDKAA